MSLCALDVGAHWGEVMLDYARLNPDVPVYAFEPDPRDAARIAVALPNYHVLAVAIDERDGIGELVINRVPGCSSLHRQDNEGLMQWPGGQNFAELGRLTVPTMRLDTFLGYIGADAVTWLKIDTQGHDLAVLRSLGDRIDLVQKITVEVRVGDTTAYVDTPTRQEIVDYVFAQGFDLVHIDAQTAGVEQNWTFVNHHD